VNGSRPEIRETFLGCPLPTSFSQRQDIHPEFEFSRIDKRRRRGNLPPDRTWRTEMRCDRSRKNGFDQDAFQQIWNMFL
jgi:hypothetical protein